MTKDNIKHINEYGINDAFELFKNNIFKDNNFSKIAPPFKPIPLERITKSFDLSKFENHRKFIKINYTQKRAGRKTRFLH